MAVRAKARLLPSYPSVQEERRRSDRAWPGLSHGTVHSPVVGPPPYPASRSQWSVKGPPPQKKRPCGTVQADGLSTRDDKKSLTWLAHKLLQLVQNSSWLAAVAQNYPAKWYGLWSSWKEDSLVPKDPWAGGVSLLFVIWRQLIRVSLSYQFYVGSFFVTSLQSRIARLGRKWPGFFQK